MTQSLSRVAKLAAFCCLLAVTLTAACVKLPRRAAIGSESVAPFEQPNSTRQIPRISLNGASREELEKLPGIGPALAARIIEHRERYGPFRRAEHLLMVRGISDRRFRQLRSHIAVE